MKTNTDKLMEGWGLKIREIVLEAYIEGLLDGRASGNQHIKLKDLRKGEKATYKVETLKDKASQAIQAAREEAIRETEMKKDDIVLENIKAVLDEMENRKSIKMKKTISTDAIAGEILPGILATNFFEIMHWIKSI